MSQHIDEEFSKIILEFGIYLEVGFRVTFNYKISGAAAVHVVDLLLVYYVVYQHSEK